MGADDMIVFTGDDWQKYLGDPGPVPRMVGPAEKYLSRPCQAEDGKKACETSAIVLIPAAVNGRPLTLDYLQELVRAPLNGGYASKLVYDEAPEVRARFGSEPSPHSKASYWVMMTRDVVTGTRGRPYAEQAGEVTSRMVFVPPHVLEVATVCLALFVKYGAARRMFASSHVKGSSGKASPLTYTRCVETVHGSRQVTVGDFDAVEGLFVGYDYYPRVEYMQQAMGLAGLHYIMQDESACSPPPPRATPKLTPAASDSTPGVSQNQLPRIYSAIPDNRFRAFHPGTSGGRGPTYYPSIPPALLRGHPQSFNAKMERYCGQDGTVTSVGISVTSASAAKQFT